MTAATDVAADATDPRTPSTSEDLRYGQPVIVTARWILIASGLLIALWMPEQVARLRVEIAATFLLAGINFYLHAQLLTRRRVLDSVVYAASVGDLAVITAIIAAQGGYESGNYIFYYPAVLAFSVAFPRSVTIAFTGTVIGVYVLLATASLPLQVSGADLTAVFLRMMALAAVATCGILYWGVERDRRERVAAAERMSVR